MVEEDRSETSQSAGRTGTSPAKENDAKSTNSSEIQAESPIATEIKRFVNHVQSLGSSMLLTMLMMGAALKVARTDYEKFLDECECTSVGPPKRFGVSPDRYHEYVQLETELERTHIAMHVVPKSFVVALVSQFDSFLGGMIRALFNLRPELLNSSERILTFKELKEFNSLDEARDFILEKEIETLLRKSHAEQFDWMESKFKVKLREDLASWPLFVEVTERRNLFVHCNGVVSRQYLSVCAEHGVEGLSALEPGSTLEVSPEYFSKAHECVFEIGVKLGHVLWRKLCAEQRASADDNLSDICFGLLQEPNYKLAQNLLDFAVRGLKKYSSDVVRRIFVINKAQSHKWLGDSPGCLATLEGEDWSACDDKFQIAIAVLKDDFTRALLLMRRMGGHGPLQKSSYRSWPIFKELRKRKDFRDAYLEVFGEDFERADTEAASTSDVTNDPSKITVN